MTQPDGQAAEHTAAPGERLPELPAACYPPDVALLPTVEEVADARAAYVAYGETTGGRNFRGEPMPAWDGLGDTIQRAWIAAAAAVRARVERDVAARGTAARTGQQRDVFVVYDAD